MTKLEVIDALGTPAVPVGAPCSCPAPGPCPRRGGRSMVAPLWQRCQSDADFRRVWDVQYGDPGCVRKDTRRPDGAAPVPDIPGAPTAAECGVVIGHYGMPGLIDLQLRLLGKHCGPVRVLLSDDGTPGDPLRVWEAAPAVTLATNVPPLGHAGGDLAAFFRAVVWGRQNRLRYVAKLSQRFVIDRPAWLLDGARRLHASGLPAATNACTQGGTACQVRTEAVLIDVARWNRPDVLAWLEPRPIPRGASCEYVILSALLTYLGGKVLAWDLLGGPERYHKSPDVLWHQANGVGEYRALAAREGVDLGPDFHTGGWEDVQKEAYRP